MGCSGSKDASETANPAAGGSAAASRESPAVTSAKSQSCEELYSFGKELGSGAYSQVYLCREKKTKEEYAVKKITKANLESYDHDALKDEVNLLRSCDWPHIIKFKEFYDEKEYYYLITEVVAGGELFDRICDKMTYNEAEARDLVATFLKTLQYLHNRKIAHRDLKPENLLLRSKSNDTDVVLADFGFAQPTNGKSLRQVCGTPDYVAPEVIMCNDVDPTKPRDRKTGRPVYANPAYDFQCDIWSAGVIVFILLGGYPPFQAKDENDRDALFELIKRGKFKFHEKYWKNVSAEAKDLITQMLKVDPDERATADELLKHPWLGLQGLEANIIDTEQLKSFNAKRKLKGVGKAVLSTVKMKNAINAFQASRSTSKA